MTRLSPLLLLLLAGCAPGKATVLVTLDASPAVSGIDHLRIAVIATGVTSQPVEVKVPGAPASVPPSQMLTVTFSPAQRGVASITIEALDASNKVLAVGTSPAQVTVSEQTKATITLGPPTPTGGGDGGMPDAAGPGPDGGTPPDQAQPADQAGAQDLAAADLATPDDLSVPADLAKPADLSPPDDLTTED